MFKVRGGKGSLSPKADTPPELEVPRKRLASEDEPQEAKARLALKPWQKYVATIAPQRCHLGTMFYNPTTTWDLLQFAKLHGLAAADKERLRQIQAKFVARLQEHSAEKCYMPMIPPLTAEYINSYLEIKVPYRFIKSFREDWKSKHVQRRRELWGGVDGIYSDDLDVLHVLCHLGLFDDALDLTGVNPDWTPRDVVRPLRVQEDSDGVPLLDLLVTVLMLPGLGEYRGSYRHGLNSRSWTRHECHNGLSFGVYAVSWETMLVPVADRSLRGPYNGRRAAGTEE